MNHGLNNMCLYSAKKIKVEVANDLNRKEYFGTGFIIIKDGNVFLITNRHLVDIKRIIDDRQLTNDYKIIKITLDNRKYNKETNKVDSCEEREIFNIDSFIYHPNPNNDIACLMNPQVFGNEFYISCDISLDLVATNEELENELSVCDFVSYPGFSEWEDTLNNNPIFRSGTISSDPKFNYGNKETNKYGDTSGDIIAYEAFSSGGNSGSPIFALQKGFKVDGTISTPKNFYRRVMLIGINAGHYKGNLGHSGISYLFKSSAILELIDFASK